MKFGIRHFVGQKDTVICVVVEISSDRISPIGSSYFHLLDYSAQKPYLMKLKVDGHDLKDPYDIPDELWLDDPSKWPEIQFGDIYTYLINTPVIFTKENLQAYKSLEAYNYFYNGYVHTVYYYDASQKTCMLKALVNPSQKSAEKAHLPWIMIYSDSECTSIKVRHCTCMAG